MRWQPSARVLASLKRRCEILTVLRAKSPRRQRVARRAGVAWPRDANRMMRAANSESEIVFREVYPNCNTPRRVGSDFAATMIAASHLCAKVLNSCRA